MTAFFAGLLGIVAVLVGAVAGHILAARKSRKDELSRMRLEAYSDFLRATSYLVSARRMGSVEDDPGDLGLLNDAKVRICVCGPTVVIESLTEFWLQGGTLEKEQEILAFTRLCQSMRNDLGQDRIESASGLSAVLFRLEPSTYSYKSARGS